MVFPLEGKYRGKGRRLRKIGRDLSTRDKDKTAIRGFQDICFYPCFIHTHYLRMVF